MNTAYARPCLTPYKGELLGTEKGVGHIGVMGVGVGEVIMEGEGG